MMEEEAKQKTMMTMTNEEIIPTLNFTCPVCDKEVTEEDAEQENGIFDGEHHQFYHTKCLESIKK